jgi:carboxyl-terminal processing protease
LRDGSAFRLTVARYYTPSGRLIQRSYEGKDKIEYQIEAFQREESEGENLEHIHDAKSDTVIPTFKTNSGRVVLGGGGITPDYLIKSEKVTGLVQTILRRSIFFDFCKNYMEGSGYSLRARYGKNYEDFKQHYKIPNEVMTDFRKYIETKEVKIDENEYAKDYNFLSARLKAQIARTLFGLEGEIGILIEIDNQVQKALTLFPEAEKIAKLE